MDFDNVRRILRGLDLPEGGFEDVLAELDRLKAREPTTIAQRYLRQRRAKVAGRKISRAA